VEREQGLAFGLEVIRLDGLSDRVSAGLVLSNGFQEGTAFLDVEESQGSFSYEWLGASFSPICVQMRGSGRVDAWSGWVEASCGAEKEKRSWRGDYTFQHVEGMALKWVLHEPLLSVPLRGSLVVKLPLDEPEVELTAYTDDIDLSRLTGAPTAALAISAGLCLKDGESTAYAMATGLTHCAVYGECVVPMNYSLNPVLVEPERNRPIYGRMSVDMDFQFLSPLLQAFQQNVGGVLQGKVALGGTLDEPEIQGSMNMVDGLYENYIWGTLLRAVQLNLRFTENRLLIEQAEAQDGTTGTVSLSGDWSFGKKRGPPLNLHLRANQATLVNQPTLQLTLGADLDVSGGLTNLSITGTTVVEKASVNIQRTMPPDVADMNIVENNKPGTPQPVVKRAEKTTPRTRLNLEVVLPGKLFIFGRGLTSEWRGRLRVEGAAEDPQVIGEVRLVKGVLMFLGKRLSLTDCSITFDGNRPIMPQVELRAFAITPELTAYLRVYGPASNVRVEISSDPVRPQDEVLSMLLFGKRADQLSATEALRMAYGIQVLRGETPGDGWMNRLQTTLQLDQVGLRQNAQDQTQLAVGRYFGDYLYVEGEKSLQGDADTLMVEISLTPSLQLRAKAASEESAGQSVYLHWRHDY
ncbi:MAG: translocation/assembly module TamB domain-containing protein, partial [Kiritimatiellae bacterium]|nr:translocation/assembly module TamB domain-containing protein [Kiritimatiellia bacterium]